MPNCGQGVERIARRMRGNVLFIYVCRKVRPPKGFSLRRGSAAGGGEARNPPLPVADIGGCSANEATSFASVSAAKRLCRIVRAVAAAAALSYIVMITAISWPTPHHRLRRSLSSRRSLLVAVLSNDHESPLISAPNHAPPWHTDRRSAQGWRSQTEGESRKRTEESLLSSGRFRLSPATGQQCRLPF